MVDNRGRDRPVEIEITDEMIAAGVDALAVNCPMDDAFPIGGEEDAVLAVLEAALKVQAADRLVPAGPSRRGNYPFDVADTRDTISERDRAAGYEVGDVLTFAEEGRGPEVVKAVLRLPR